MLLTVVERVACENTVSASRTNKAEMVFVKERDLVYQMIEHKTKVSGERCSVTPLSAATTEVTVSDIPPFIPDIEIWSGTCLIV